MMPDEMPHADSLRCRTCGLDLFTVGADYIRCANCGTILLRKALEHQRAELRKGNDNTE